MVYSNESMTDKNGLDVNHFEAATPMHDVGDILWKKIPPGHLGDNSQID